VGAWQLVQELGVGGTSRVFKVQRNGRFYTLKMALSPLSPSEDEEKRPAEEQVQVEGAHRRLAREVSALLTYASHPQLLRVYAVDFWPDPAKGYPYLVTKFVDGDTWHAWRWRTRPDARALVDTFTDVVRAVGGLHSRGVYHRDLKAENILIRRSDGRAFVIDLGSARLPSAYTQTLGLPEGTLHLMPPEFLAYMRSEAWKQGEAFTWAVTADLYALGALLYESLTDHHAFDPKLSDTALLAAIASVRPTPPHALNPRAPRSLSDLCMTLLEKRPEDRCAHTEALLEALERMGPERSSPEWTVPLLEAREEPAESTPVLEVPREVPAAPREEAPPAHRSTPRRPRGARRLGVVLACLTLTALVLWLARSTLAPSPKGSPTMPASAPAHDAPTRRPGVLAAWLCASMGLGCAGAQVKPPEPEDCPREAREAMEKLTFNERTSFLVDVDIRQPGETDSLGVYQDGPVVGRVLKDPDGPQRLPEGTLLHGRLWTGPGIYEVYSTGRKPGVMGRYTLAVLPDGRSFPVCIALGNGDGRVAKYRGSTPEVTVLARTQPTTAVWRWP
jgi:serine/threonine-protein kinase